MASSSLERPPKRFKFQDGLSELSDDVLQLIISMVYTPTIDDSVDYCNRFKEEGGNEEIIYRYCKELVNLSMTNKRLFSSVQAFIKQPSSLPKMFISKEPGCGKCRDTKLSILESHLNRLHNRVDSLELTNKYSCWHIRKQLLEIVAQKYGHSLRRLIFEVDDQLKNHVDMKEAISKLVFLREVHVFEPSKNVLKGIGTLQHLKTLHLKSIRDPSRMHIKRFLSEPKNTSNVTNLVINVPANQTRRHFTMITDIKLKYICYSFGGTSDNYFNSLNCTSSHNAQMFDLASKYIFKYNRFDVYLDNRRKDSLYPEKLAEKSSNLFSPSETVESLACVVLEVPSILLRICRDYNRRESTIWNVRDDIPNDWEVGFETDFCNGRYIRRQQANSEKTHWQLRMLQLDLKALVFDDHDIFGPTGTGEGYGYYEGGSEENIDDLSESQVLTSYNPEYLDLTHMKSVEFNEISGPFLDHISYINTYDGNYFRISPSMRIYLRKIENFTIGSKFSRSVLYSSLPTRLLITTALQYMANLRFVSVCTDFLYTMLESKNGKYSEASLSYFLQSLKHVEVFRIHSILSYTNDLGTSIDSTDSNQSCENFVLVLNAVVEDMRSNMNSLQKISLFDGKIPLLPDNQHDAMKALKKFNNVISLEKYVADLNKLSDQVCNIKETRKNLDLSIVLSTLSLLKEQAIK